MEQEEPVMKLKLIGVYFGETSWRLHFGCGGEKVAGVYYDFELTVMKKEVTPGMAAFYDSLKPGDEFELTRIHP